MGKNKKGVKANVFKVAGAKSLKKSKAKAVNLGLRDIKQKVKDIDAEFIEINKTPKPTPVSKKPAVKKHKKPEKKKTTPQDVAKTAEQIVKMDL
ncbi:unnamed protein product [Plutella xylostella]|uniref:(diamondback moth) hypothetical protein n=1 Tax=Plutella xylostella TaxID=51655 RepID=A0A8S4EP97_PLUXY|nr:unnamed protein product [Plutella xylostella]